MTIARMMELIVMKQKKGMTNLLAADTIDGRALPFQARMTASIKYDGTKIHGNAMIIAAVLGISASSTLSLKFETKSVEMLIACRPSSSSVERKSPKDSKERRAFVISCSRGPATLIVGKFSISSVVLPRVSLLPTRSLYRAPASEFPACLVIPVNKDVTSGLTVGELAAGILDSMFPNNELNAELSVMPVVLDGGALKEVLLLQKSDKSANNVSLMVRALSIVI